MTAITTGLGPVCLGVEVKPVYRDRDVLEVRVRASNGAFAGSVNVYFGPDRLRNLASD